MDRKMNWGQLSDHGRRVLQNRLDARALYLIECGFRTAIIQLETGMTASRIRSLTHGLSEVSDIDIKPSSGLLPESENILRTRAHNTEGTLFLLFYLQLAGEAAKVRINIDAVIKAHRLLTERRSVFGFLFTSQPLDVNQCWVLARDFRSPSKDIPALIQLRHCQVCNTPYIEVAQQRTRLSCPFCAIESGLAGGGPKRQIIKTAAAAGGADATPVGS
jgi:hypothetical protein